MFCLFGFKMSYVLFHPRYTKIFPNLKCCYIISYRSYSGVCTHLKIIKYWLLKICSNHIAKPQIKSFSPWKLFFFLNKVCMDGYTFSSWISYIHTVIPVLETWPQWIRFASRPDWWANSLSAINSRPDIQLLWH